MNISRRRHLAAILLIAGSTLLGIGRDARGGFIASDLGPGGSFNPLTGYNVTGPGAFTGQGYGIAVEFGVGGSAPVEFGSASLALAFRGGNNALSVVLASDNGGVPGASLETFALGNLSAVASLVTVTSKANPMLQGGSNYWLEATTTGNSNFTWLANSQGSTNHLADEVNTGSGFGGWSTAPGYADPAFSVSAAAVPAPPSLVMLGLGALGVIGSIARRRLLAA